MRGEAERWRCCMRRAVRAAGRSCLLRRDRIIQTAGGGSLGGACKSLGCDLQPSTPSRVSTGGMSSASASAVERQTRKPE